MYRPIFNILSQTDFQGNSV